MQITEKTKEEIQARADRMSDFLKIEYLELCSRNRIDVEILRYCFLELARLYEKNIMYKEAVKYISKFREVVISQKEKIQTYIKEIELFIKGGFYDQANLSYKKVLMMVDETQKFEIRRKVIELYNLEANKFEKTNKNAWALKVYEKLLPLVSDAEKTEVKKKLLVLYKKLGKIRESIEMEKEIMQNK